MIHPAESQITEALALQARLLAALQASHDGFRGSRFPWCDLSALNETNRRISEALGFVRGTEGTTILQALKGA